MSAELELPSNVIDCKTPNRCRVLNYLLGGKDHFAEDRNMVQSMRDLFPSPVDVALAEMDYRERAIGQLANRGVSQYLDLSPGLPETGTIARWVRHITPARVVYAETDMVALSHLRAFEENSSTAVYKLDIRELATLLKRISWDGALAFHQPICVVLSNITSVLDPGGLPRLFGILGSRLAPKSTIVFTFAEPQMAQTYTPLYGGGIASADLANICRASGWVVHFPGIRPVRIRHAARLVDPAAVPVLGGTAYLPSPE